MAERVSMTEDQKKLSYAKYMDKPLAEVPAEKLPLGETPMDPAKALKIEDRNKLFEPGYMEVETGFCVMQDGTGYIANLTYMPGVTTEMFDWWFAWHGLGELRSRFWLGYNIVGGKAVRILPEDEVTPLEKAQLLLKHNMEEFQNLADLLPRIYPEEKDNW